MLLTIYFLILLAAILAVGLTILFFIRKKVRLLNDRIAQQQNHIWESHNVLRVLSGMTAFPAPGGWAATTDILAELGRQVLTQRPSVVVELGSGLSTLVIASALKRNGGGRLISIDGDEAYAEKTRQQLELHGLSDWAEVRYSKISDIVFEGERRPWYDTSKFDDLQSIDLLFVDGPPAPIRADIRRPSLPWFWNKLNTGAITLLDDASRLAERTIQAAWQESFPSAKFEFLPFEKGALRVTKI